MRRKVKEVAKPRKMVVAVFNMGLSFPLYFEREKSLLVSANFVVVQLFLRWDFECVWNNLLGYIYF